VKKTFLVIGLLMLSAGMLTGCEKELGVKKIEPAMGVLGGGEPVDIQGSGFKADMGISVYFGNTKVNNVVIRGSNKLTISTPSSDVEGSVDVRVITDDGHEFFMKSAFTYVKTAGMDIGDLGKRRSIRKTKD